MEPPYVWVVLKGYDWEEVPLTGANNVNSLRKKIKRALAPKIIPTKYRQLTQSLRNKEISDYQYEIYLNKEYASVEIFLKAVLSTGDENNAVPLDPRHSLYDVLVSFGVEVNHTVQEMFAQNISIFVYLSQVEPPIKRQRIDHGWVYFTADDRQSVLLPPKVIEMLMSDKNLPAPRNTFKEAMANSSTVGNIVTIPEFGQNPKHFDNSFLGRNILITEQMIHLWAEINRVPKQERAYKRVLSGPMGVGKSYLALFLATMAYANDWLVLYMADAAELLKATEQEAAEAFCQRFLTLNKDILTSTELGLLVENADNNSVQRSCAGAILNLLKDSNRKTLLIVDEHGALFRSDPPFPMQFPVFLPLMLLNWWGEQPGPCVLFTGTAQAGYEMKYLDHGMLLWWVEYVGPLSDEVFRKLLSLHSNFNSRTDLVDLVVEVTNRVPREFMYLEDFTKGLNFNVISKDEFKSRLDAFKNDRVSTLLPVAKNYFNGLPENERYTYIESLTCMFLVEPVGFEWKFLDLGLTYRLKDHNNHMHHYPLCPSAKQALFRLYLEQDLPPTLRSMVISDNFDGDALERAFFFRLMTKCNRPVVLNTTNLVGEETNPIILNFVDFDTISTDRLSLGQGYENVLARGFDGYPRFDFMIGRIFIQISISNFKDHNSKVSKDISRAFLRPMPKVGRITTEQIGGRNQIEVYLDEMFGRIDYNNNDQIIKIGHTADIDPESKKFIVRDPSGFLVPDFHIVYIHGSPGSPNHPGKFRDFPDILHVSYDELKKTIFNNL